MDKATLNRPNKPLLMGFAYNKNIKPFSINLFSQFVELIGILLFLILTFFSISLMAEPETRVVDSERSFPKNLDKLSKSELFKVAREHGINPHKVKWYKETSKGYVVKFNDGSKINIEPTPKNIQIEFENNKPTKESIHKNKKIEPKHNQEHKSDSYSSNKWNNRPESASKVYFDDSGLIGFKTDTVVHKIESKYDVDLDRVNYKNTPNKQKLVAIFKPKAKKSNKRKLIRKPKNSEPSHKHKSVDNTSNLIISKPIFHDKAPEKNVVRAPSDDIVKDSEPKPTQETANLVEKTQDVQPSLQESDSLSIANETPVIQKKMVVDKTTPFLDSSTTTTKQQLAQIEQPIISEPLTEAVSKKSTISQPIIGQQIDNPSQPITLNLGNLDKSKSPPVVSQPLFNARIADSSEEVAETESSGGQSMPINQIAYVDVNAISKKNTNMFGTIGTGIGMKLGQCEEMDGCAPNLDENRLDELEENLQAELDLLKELDAKKSSSHTKRKKQALLFKMNALKQHREQLNLFNNQQLENQVAMDDLSKPDMIPESKYPHTEEDNSLTANNFDMSQFDTSIFEDYQAEIPDDL